MHTAAARKPETVHPALRVEPSRSSRARDADERTKDERKTYWTLIVALVTAFLGVVGYAVASGKLHF